MSRLRFTPCLVGFAGLLVPSSARAELVEVEPIALRYEATAGCPLETEFVAAVRKYTTRWSLVPEGTPMARTIRVRISPRTSGLVGKIEVANTNDAVSERVLEGPSCQRVSAGLAVMVALAIDSPSQGSSQAPSPEVPDAPTVEPDEPAKQPPERPVTPRSPPPTPAPKPPTAGPRVSLDLRLETSSAVLRGAVPGVGASMKLEPPSSASWLGTWKPSVGLGVRRSFLEERALRGGEAEFRWTTANVRMCPLRLPIGAAVDVSPCAEIDVGVLHASARGFASATRLSSFWLDVGGSIWAAVHISERFFFSSTMLVTVPVNRQPFVLSGGTPIASVPPIGILYGLGAGVRL